MLEYGQVQLAFIGGLGAPELIVLFLIVLLLFGAKRIPEIAHGIGKGIMEFKKAAHDITDEFEVDDSSKNYVKNELKGQQIKDKPHQKVNQTQKKNTSQS